MRTKQRKPAAPVCTFCKRTGAGVTFAMFNPRFAPFGTACTDCERDLPTRDNASQLAIQGTGPFVVGVLASLHPLALKPLATFATLAEAQAAHAAAYRAVVTAVSV